MSWEVGPRIPSFPPAPAPPGPPRPPGFATSTTPEISRRRP